MTVIDKYIADRLGWEWGETGVSSDAMLRQALGGRPVSEWEYPSDWSDLARCRTTYRMAPWALRRRMKPILRDFRSHVREREKAIAERDLRLLGEDFEEELRMAADGLRPGTRFIDGERLYSADWLGDDPALANEPPQFPPWLPPRLVRHDDDCKCGKCIGQPRYGPPLDTYEP